VATELLIVGAGPAGVSAALWAKSLGLDALVIESSDKVGGQLHHIYFHPRDLAGVTTGVGAEIAARYHEQLAAADVEIRFGVAAGALEAGRGERPCVISGYERLEASAVLIATGARRRTLDVPGERELDGRGVTYSATRDRERLRGKRVVVVGGGDGAYENALNLADEGSEVTIVVRDNGRARKEFRDRVAASPRIRVVEDTHVSALIGGDVLRSVRLVGPKGEYEEPAEAVVIKVGVMPNTEWCRDALALDEEGFIKCDPRGRVSRANVWAAGDVVSPLRPSIAASIGGAALAVADIRVALRGH
jgi:thioredoxin reductase (NADPH)